MIRQQTISTISKPGPGAKTLKVSEKKGQKSPMKTPSRNQPDGELLNHNYPKLPASLEKWFNISANSENLNKSVNLCIIARAFSIIPLSRKMCRGVYSFVFPSVHQSSCSLVCPSVLY